MSTVLVNVGMISLPSDVGAYPIVAPAAPARNFLPGQGLKKQAMQYKGGKGEGRR
jgi:hypothetical protein